MKFLPLILSLFSCTGAVYTDLDVAGFESVAAESEVAVLDVRTADEYAAGHLRWASNCDWYADDFMDRVQAAYPKQTPLAVYCRSGKRSAAAAAKLAKAGYKVYNLRGGYLAWSGAGKPTTTYAVEIFFTDSNLPVAIALIKHGTLALRYRGLTFQVDPVAGLGRPTDYAAEFPKADYILVTHEHGDHLDKDAIAALTDSACTRLITNARCAGMLGYGTVMSNGDRFVLTAADSSTGDRIVLPADSSGGDRIVLSTAVILEAVPAYNCTEGRTQFHPKGRDNGFVLTFDGLRIYISGDTEDIPEMSGLEDIDVAFLPVNQPYTMTVEQCVSAAGMISPKVLIPYHFSDTDLSALPAMLPAIDVRLRQMQ